MGENRVERENPYGVWIFPFRILQLCEAKVKACKSEGFERGRAKHDRVRTLCCCWIFWN